MSHLLLVPPGPQVCRENHYGSFISPFKCILQCVVFPACREMLLWSTKHGEGASLRCSSVKWFASDISLRTPAYLRCLFLPVYCNSLPCQLFHSKFFWKMLKADQETYLVKYKSPLTNIISHWGQCTDVYSVVPSTDPSTSKRAVRHSTVGGEKTFRFLN